MGKVPFPVYGLTPEWTGNRDVHSAGVSLGEVTHVALRHGTGPGHPELVVDTLYGEERAPADAPFHATLHLDAGAGAAAAGGAAGIGGAAPGGEPPWQSRSFPVDGRDQVFWFRAAGERWAAFARVGMVRVVVAATRWDPAAVALAVVAAGDYVGEGSTTRR